MNTNVKRRDEIIFGKYEPERYLGGCRRFTCSRDTIETLLNEDFIELDECQNYSPSTKEFLESTIDLEKVEFECYVINADRDDYRVTIEGVDIEINDSNYKDISYAIETFHNADEFNFYHNESSYFLHAWWD